jgi:hypothetical protein
MVQAAQSDWCVRTWEGSGISELKERFDCESVMNTIHNMG